MRIGEIMLEKILDYQKTEAELISTENELLKSSDREKASEIQQVLKNQHSRLVALEKAAERINLSYTKAKEKYQEYLKKLETLEKEISSMYTEVQQVSREYEDIIKKSKSDRLKFDKYKASYSKLKAEKEPIISELKAKLETMKKGIDERLFQIYSQKREGRLFPVFVALNATKCGGCRMEISASKLGAMNTNKYGVIECENCGRYIYKK